MRNESDVLREELKEDKWLTVFRTVTDQADGMMSSLEKAVNRCQVSCHALCCSVVVIKLLRNSFGKCIGEALRNHFICMLLYHLLNVTTDHHL